jgi:hypothetical protein
VRCRLLALSGQSNRPVFVRFWTKADKLGPKLTALMHRRASCPVASLHRYSVRKLIMLTLKPTGLGQPNDFEVLDQDLRREEQGYTRRCRLFLHMERERMCPLEN